MCIPTKYFIFFCICSQAWLSAAEPSAGVLFRKYCFDCHSDGVEKGKLALDKLFKLSRKDPKNRKQWHKTWDVIEKEQMPPADKKAQPTDQEREIMMIAIETAVYNIKRANKYASNISLIRMSNQQYSNSAANLTGIDINYAKYLPLDPPNAGFDNIGTTLSITPILFERYQKIAEAASLKMFDPKTKHPDAKERVKKLMDLSGDGSDSRRVMKAINMLAFYGFRRSPSKIEKAELMKLYLAARKKNDHRGSMQELMHAILISPNFIFRTELLLTDKRTGSFGRLNEYALASRMAYFLWNSTPDSELILAASQGQIRSNLKKTIERLIQDKKFKQMIESFGLYWLGIQYLENNIPDRGTFNLSKTHLSKMKQETTHFLKYMFTANKPINELFTSRETFVDADLASHYGLTISGSGFQKVTTPDSHMRRGILSQPSILIVTSDPDRTSPVKRGQWLLERILGMPPPPAPADIPALEESGKGQKNLTLEDRLKIHREDSVNMVIHEHRRSLTLAHSMKVVETFSIIKASTPLLNNPCKSLIRVRDRTS
jgi:hypothetical protein